MNISKFMLSAHSLDELVALGTITAPAAGFLEAVVTSDLNSPVSGDTRAGKATLLTAHARSRKARRRTT